MRSEARSASILKGEVVDAAARLADEVDGDVVVYASSGLVGTLMAHHLVDELRLRVWPLVVGAGRRLLGETAEAHPLRLVDARTIGDGMVVLTYRPPRSSR